MSTISANTFLAADGTPTTEPSIPALDQRMAKAWVSFNGTGTVAIRTSYNVSSITDSGVGIYDINFITNMPNTDYVISIATNSNLDDTPWLQIPTASYYQIRTFNGTSYVDVSRAMSLVFSS